MELGRPTEPLAIQLSRGSANKHIKYLNLLSKIAYAIQPVAQARIASAIVYKNDVISIGINQRKSHPFQKIFGKNSEAIYLHSEVDCIKNALKIIDVDQLQKCTLYVCRVKYQDHFKSHITYGLAKPCPGCQRAIANFNIRTVYYSLDNDGYSQL